MWKLICLSFSFIVLAEGKGYPAPLPALTLNGTVPSNYPKPGHGYRPAVNAPMRLETEIDEEYPNYLELSPSWPWPFEPITVDVDNNVKKAVEKKEGLQILMGTFLTFLVVDDDQVIGDFYDIERAKEELREVSGGWGRSRLIAEVDKDGNLKRDPHIVAGQKQEQQSGFNKWWRNWNDINRMMDVCEDYLKMQKEGVKVAEEGCGVQDGKARKEGETWKHKDGCNTCTCYGGSTACTLALCVVNCKKHIQNTRRCFCGYRECDSGETCALSGDMGDGVCVKECRNGRKMGSLENKCTCNGLYCNTGETCFGGFCITVLNCKKDIQTTRRCDCGNEQCSPGETCTRDMESMGLDMVCLSENGTATKLPNRALNTKLPNTTLNTELPNAALNTESPNAALNTKLPNATLNTESPNEALNTKLPNATLNTESPNADLKTEVPHASLNTKSPNATINTKSPNTTLNTKSPNTTLNKNENLTSPEPIRQIRKIKKMIKKKKKNGKATNLHKAHPRKDQMATSRKPINQSEDMLDVSKTTTIMMG